ncbi:hypothetical protein AAG906_026465 [Vitis piasezkii]
MDLGATHHFTPKFRHMTNAMQYLGGDHALEAMVSKLVYLILAMFSPPTQALLSQQNQAVLWQNRLSHPAPKVVHQVLQSYNLKFLNSEHFFSKKVLVLGITSAYFNMDSFSKFETSLFVIPSGSSTTILLVYTDDNIVTGFRCFTLFFLGIQVTSTTSTLHLCQQKHIFDLLHCALMFECKPITTLMAFIASISLYDAPFVIALHSNVHQAYLLHVLLMLIRLVALMTGKVLVTIVVDGKILDLFIS